MKTAEWNHRDLNRYTATRTVTDVIKARRGGIPVDDEKSVAGMGGPFGLTSMPNITQVEPCLNNLVKLMEGYQILLYKVLSSVTSVIAQRFSRLLLKRQWMAC